MWTDAGMVTGVFVSAAEGTHVDFPALPAEMSDSDAPVAHPVPGLGFSHRPPVKGRGTPLEEAAEPKAGAGETHHEPRTSFGDRGSDASSKQRGHGSQPEGAPGAV